MMGCSLVGWNRILEIMKCYRHYNEVPEANLRILTMRHVIFTYTCKKSGDILSHICQFFQLDERDLCGYVIGIIHTV